MLLTIALHRPEMLPTILARTPTWVWGLLAALLALGASQLRDRSAGLARISVMPLAMGAFAGWGMVSAFGSSPMFGQVLVIWLGTAAGVTAALAPGQAAATYDVDRREYRLPGSVLPLLLIAGVFMVKWGVGVEMALQPGVVRDAAFALPVAAIYGVINGLFLGRTARLWHLAARSPVAAVATV